MADSLLHGGHQSHVAVFVAAKDYLLSSFVIHRSSFERCGGRCFPNRAVRHGNTPLLILGIVLAWILAAFGEENVYRGYLTNRVAEIFGASKKAWIVAALLVTLLFGFAHFHQGPTGVTENIIDGAILAALYFATGRNLWAPIIAHGTQDTVDVLLTYLGWYPGFQQSLGLSA